MNIFILHPAKANYPEILAYKNFFCDKFDVFDGGVEQYKNFGEKDNTILWCIMGFYPRKLKAKYVIHDYRSLSVGRLSRLKDRIKKYVNVTPNLRVFQNELIENVMGFNDGVPSLLLPMGVPDWIFDLEPDPSLPKGTYCYIGEISRERGMDSVIDAFRKNISVDQTLVLVGSPDVSILEKNKGVKNIVFTGKLPQREALKVVLNCEYAISRIPSRYPYCYQAPTKYLEYAALGKTILCNQSPSNYMAFRRVQSNAVFVSSHIFSEAIFQSIDCFESEPQQAPTKLRWKAVITDSKIEKYLGAFVE
ncbi:glycosyltransferase family 1 protein [Pseudomonas sp. LPB0260]|nr:glycosyltransferase family 1 protein [Pseudomonas sp. LPB0260]